MGGIIKLKGGKLVVELDKMDEKADIGLAIAIIALFAALVFLAVSAHDIYEARYDSPVPTRGEGAKFTEFKKK